MSLKSRRLWLAIVLIAAGCGGVNPFISARFALQATGEGLAGKGAGGGTSTQPSTANNIRNTCDLATARKRLNSFGLVNLSSFHVNYNITFLASAGTGGFVCDADLNAYQNAGYRAFPLNAATKTATIGCDDVPLLQGTSMLALQINGQLAAAITPSSTGRDVATGQLAAAPLNGTTAIPVPELIVLGGSGNFTCTGSDGCTQSGFVYTDLSGNRINTATASRTQNTICNAGVGNLPEWRLTNVNIADSLGNVYQYPAGAFISVAVLDLANNTQPADDKVIWQVNGLDGTTIHRFSR